MELVAVQPQQFQLLCPCLHVEQLAIILPPPARGFRLVEVEHPDVERLVARVVPADAFEELVVGARKGGPSHLTDGEDGRDSIAVPGLVPELVGDDVRLGDGGRHVGVDDCIITGGTLGIRTAAAQKKKKKIEDSYNESV